VVAVLPVQHDGALGEVMDTQAVFFPFDLFGSGGAAAGAALLADELREVLADNRREQVATRADVYTRHVRIREFAFDTLAKYQSWRATGRRAVRRVLDRGDFLLWVAGNHLGVLPVYDELASRDDVLVVQLDAHLDIHHFHDCTAELSHGNFLLHCAGPLPPLINAGHRDLLLTPEHVARSYRQTFAAAELAVDAAPAVDAIRQAAAAAQRVFLDIDWDVFDSAYFPAVAQPVPFGLAPPAVLRLIDAAWGPNLAGVMLSEFDPGRDRNDQSLAIAVWLLEYVLLRRHAP
jgi:arginase family enzyme